MAILGDNRYGKAEVRLVRVDRGREPHALADWNVSVSLAGDMREVHLSGANDRVLPTDTQKNTVYALARQLGAVEPEAFALALARHFVDRPGRASAAPGCTSRATAGRRSGRTRWSGPAARCAP